MDDRVLLEPARRLESLLADGAAERLLRLGVRFHVPLHVALLRKGLGADRAAERPLPGVGSHVLLKIGLLIKIRGTDRAAERFFSRVGPHVSLQQRRVLEVFPAMRAPVGFAGAFRFAFRFAVSRLGEFDLCLRGGTLS